MKKIISKLLIVTSILVIGSCETFDLDQTQSPSQVPPELLDPVYTFNYVQLELPNFVDNANDFTQRVTRQMAMTGGNTYNNAFKPVNFNTVWSNGYNILNAIKIMEPKAIEKNELYALGASKVIRVYVLLTLVDMFGDIPYSESLQGNANLTPKFDKSADVYKGLFIELDNAIATLNAPGDNSSSKIQDLYYTSKVSWVTLANTLKLKMLNNARLTGAGAEIGIPDIKGAIATLIANNNIIDTIDEDFQFQYGNSRFNPNTRHPMYNDQYELGGGAYIGNYFMWALSEEKGSTIDPRTNYYFYKQDADPVGEDPFTIPFKSRPTQYNDAKYSSFFSSSILCTYFVSNWTTNSANLPSNGFWGRDHGDNSGIPPDAEKRTVAGIYPIGGKYGTNAASVQSSGTAGQQGAGIMPIMLSSYVHFILAEYELMENGNSTNARNELETAIRNSITKTTTFIEMPTNVPPQSQIATETNTYWNTYLLPRYNSYSTDKKLELIIKEYYIAAWGNGIEPYNNYRRTGYPSNFQPTLEEVPGIYFSTALYPGSVANNNPNMPNNVRSKKVFWDKLNVVLE